jgi:hypothetical protein
MNDLSTTPAAGPGVDQRAPCTRTDGIRLNSCRRFQTIVVNTSTSVYELIVLEGNAGDVLVQGGSRLPEFRRACFIGSVAPGSALKANCIEVGRPMRFFASDRIIVTSPVKAYHVTTPETESLS